MDIDKLLVYVSCLNTASFVAGLYRLILWFILGESETLHIQPILMSLTLNLMTFYLLWFRGKIGK